MKLFCPLANDPELAPETKLTLAVRVPLPVKTIAGSSEAPLTALVKLSVKMPVVFAWAALSGKNAPLAYWHFSTLLADGSRNWFSLLVAGDPSGQSVTSNSQAFWLPAPVDGKLTVTLFASDLASASNHGEVEIHGYYPGTVEA